MTAPPTVVKGEDRKKTAPRAPTQDPNYGEGLLDSEAGVILDLILRFNANGDNDLFPDEQRLLHNFLQSPLEDVDGALIDAMVTYGVFPEKYTNQMRVNPETDPAPGGFGTLGGGLGSQYDVEEYRGGLGHDPAVKDFLREAPTEGNTLRVWDDVYIESGGPTSGVTSTNDMGYATWLSQYLGQHPDVTRQIMELNPGITNLQGILNAAARTESPIKMPAVVQLDWGYQQKGDAIALLEEGLVPRWSRDGLGLLPRADLETYDRNNADEYARHVGEVDSHLDIPTRQRTYFLGLGLDSSTIAGLNLNDEGSIVNAQMTAALGFNYNDLNPDLQTSSMQAVQALYPHLLIDPSTGEQITEPLDASNTLHQFAFLEAVTASPQALTSAANNIANAQDVMQLTIPIMGAATPEVVWTSAGGPQYQWRDTPIGYRSVELSKAMFDQIQTGMGSWGPGLQQLMIKSEDAGIPWEIGIALLKNKTNNWQPRYGRDGYVDVLFNEFIRNVREHDSWVAGAVALTYGDSVAEELRTYGSLSEAQQREVQPYINSIFGEDGASQYGYNGSSTQVQAHQILNAPPINVADAASVREAARSLWEQYMLSDPNEAQIDAFASSIRQAEIQAGTQNNAFYEAQNSRLKGEFFKDYSAQEGLLFPINDRKALTAWRDTFGAKRTGHAHAGADISTYRGADLVAVTSGVIRLARHVNGGGGLTVRLMGDDGFGYSYLHLDSLNVQPGQRVTKGTVLGGAGDTGNANGVHLHFEVNDGTFQSGSFNPTAAGKFNPTNMLRNSTFAGDAQVGPAVVQSGGGDSAQERFANRDRVTSQSSLDLAVTGRPGDQFLTPAGPSTGDYPAGGGFATKPDIIENVDYVARAEEWLKAQPRYEFLYERKPEDVSALDYVQGYQAAAKGITGTFVGEGAVETGMRTNSITTMFSSIIGDEQNIDESPQLRQRLYQLARTMNSGG